LFLNTDAVFIRALHQFCHSIVLWLIMNKPKKNRVLRKTITLTLLPAVIFLWMVGWVLYCKSSEGYLSKASQKGSLSSYDTTFDAEDVQEEREPQILA
jgi:hypothetical protein